MSKKKSAIDENYLERVPMRAAELSWRADDAGLVTLEVENKGWANRLAQVLFHRPKVSQIHLDEHGSFVWQLIDGERNILSLGDPVREKFGEAAEPLYPRLAQFIKILDSYHFVTFKQI